MHLKESVKNEENFEESMRIPWERGTQLGFDEQGCHIPVLRR
jgi:hypothetical protein